MRHSSCERDFHVFILIRHLTIHSIFLKIFGIMIIRHYSRHPISRNHNYKTLSKLNGSTMSYKYDSEKLDGSISVHNYDSENFEMKHIKIL